MGNAEKCECGKRGRSIVMLTPDRRIDRRILLQADSLEANGWDVTILAMPLDAEIQEDDLRVVRVGTPSTGSKNKNFALNAYRWLRRRKVMNGRVMAFVKRLAWQYVVKPESFYLKLFLGSALRYSPDIYIAEDLPMLAVARQAAAQCGAKLVYDSHELYSEQGFSDREKRHWIEIERKHIHACAVVITVNQSIANELEGRYGIDNVKVIYNAERVGRNPTRTHLFHEIFSLPAERKILLFQGALSDGRNLDVLVKAMRYVQNPAVNLVVLGDGPLKPALLAYVKANGLSQQVYFHAAVPQKILLDYTEAADVGVIPYQGTCLNNYYCTPNKLFEFIAAGLPILASNLPEIQKMIHHYQIGFVGDMSKPAGLAKLIDSFFSDKQRMESWRSNTLTARQQVCWQVEEKKLLEIFNALR